MHARDLLIQQFDLIYLMVGRNIDGMTHAGSLAPSAGGGNTANWILGHLVNVQNGIMKLMGAPVVWDSESLQRAHFDHPIRAEAEAIDWDRLVERFTASRESCLAAIAAMSDEALDRKMTDPFGRDTTVARMLGLLVTHQCYHAGQLGMTRRAAGLKAAILAPGQAAAL